MRQIRVKFVKGNPNSFNFTQYYGVYYGAKCLGRFKDERTARIRASHFEDPTIRAAWLNGDAIPAITETP